MRSPQNTGSVIRPGRTSRRPAGNQGGVFSGTLKTAGATPALPIPIRQQTRIETRGSVIRPGRTSRRPAGNLGGVFSGTLKTAGSTPALPIPIRVHSQDAPDCPRTIRARLSAPPALKIGLQHVCNAGTTFPARQCGGISSLKVANRGESWVPEGQTGGGGPTA